jgi:hypothetical protein
VARLAVMSVPRHRRCAEHVKGSVRTAEQADPGDQESANHQDTGSGAEHTEQPAALSCGIGEDLAGFMPSGVPRLLARARLSHEASVGEMTRRNTNNGGVSVHQ